MADQEPESLPPLKDFEESLEIIAEAKAHHFPDIAVSASKLLREQCLKLLNSRLADTTPTDSCRSTSAPHHVDLLPATLHGIRPMPSNPLVQGDERAASEALFLSFVPPAFEKVLANLFAPYGPVKSVRIRCRTRNRPNFGFIIFKHLADAIRAKEEMKVIKFDGKVVPISFSVNPEPPSKTSQSGTELFISGLPATATQATLKEMFGKYNPVSARVAVDAKGFGHVKFPSYKEAEAAMKAMNGLPQPGGVKLHVQFSRPR